MRLGLSSYTFSWSIGVKGKEPPVRMDFPGLIDRAAGSGVKCLQVADNLPLGHFTNDELINFRNKATSSGIKIEIGTRGIQPLNLVKYLDLAELFESPILRVVIDAPDYAPDLGEINSIIKEFIPDLKRKNIKLAIENHDRLRASEFEKIIQTAGSEYIGICLDTVNSMGAGEGFEEVFRILGPYIINLHIKDFIVKRIWHSMGFEIEGRPAGQGMLPIQKIVRELSKEGKCQSGILELWTPQQKSIEDTIALELSWADESIRYLKNLFQY
jgi:sugar phosphate isomerase/epimerase